MLHPLFSILAFALPRPPASGNMFSAHAPPRTQTPDRLPRHRHRADAARHRRRRVRRARPSRRFSLRPPRPHLPGLHAQADRHARPPRHRRPRARHDRLAAAARDRGAASSTKSASPGPRPSRWTCSSTEPQEVQFEKQSVPHRRDRSRRIATRRRHATRDRNSAHRDAAATTHRPVEYLRIDHDAELAVAMRRLGNVIVPATFQPVPRYSPIVAAMVEELRKDPELEPEPLAAAPDQRGDVKVPDGGLGELFFVARREAFDIRLRELNLGPETPFDAVRASCSRARRSRVTPAPPTCCASSGTKYLAAREFRRFAWPRPPGMAVVRLDARRARAGARSSPPPPAAARSSTTRSSASPVIRAPPAAARGGRQRLPADGPRPRLPHARRRRQQAARRRTAAHADRPARRRRRADRPHPARAAARQHVGRDVRPPHAHPLVRRAAVGEHVRLARAREPAASTCR